MRIRKIRYNWLFVLLAALLICLIWGLEVNGHPFKDFAESALKVCVACYCIATLAFHLMPLAEVSVRKFGRQCSRYLLDSQPSFASLVPQHYLFSG